MMRLKLWFLRKFRYQWDINKPESDVYIGCLGKFYSDFEFLFNNLLVQSDLKSLVEGQWDSKKATLVREKVSDLALRALTGTMQDLGRKPRR